MADFEFDDPKGFSSFTMGNRSMVPAQLNAYTQPRPTLLNYTRSPAEGVEKLTKLAYD